MKTYNFTADFCGTMYGSIEAESEKDAREKLQDKLRIDAFLEENKDEAIDVEWEFKSKCHGNCCFFTGSTEDEHGIDIEEEEE